jgi:predicted LPLAT superfamily acyltransferase
VLQVPVTLAFGLYRGGNRYDLVFEAFSDRIEVPRHNRNGALSQYVHRYAQRLQHHAQRAPYNWFNFYDFWHTNDAMAAPDAHASGVLETSRDARGPAAGRFAARRVT